MKFDHNVNIIFFLSFCIKYYGKSNIKSQAKIIFIQKYFIFIIDIIFSVIYYIYFPRKKSIIIASNVLIIKKPINDVCVKYISQSKGPKGKL